MWLGEGSQMCVRRRDSFPRRASVATGRGRVVPSKPEILASPGEPDFRALFQAVPGLYLVLRHDPTIVDVSDAIFLRHDVARGDKGPSGA